MVFRTKVAVGTIAVSPKWVVQKQRGRVLALVFRVFHKVAIGADPKLVDNGPLLHRPAPADYARDTRLGVPVRAQNADIVCRRSPPFP